MVDREDGIARRATKKAMWRILPLLFCCYIVAYVDRANVGYAKLTMVRDLAGFNDEVIGMGAGLFFLGYFLLEVPGTLLVERWSARKVVSRIMVTWGVVAAGTAFVKTPGEFYGMRFLLGLAEAGFFPGVIVYLTHWFPTWVRARAMGIFLVATPVAQLVTPKVCNYLLRFGTMEAGVRYPKLMGMQGWQWVYVGWGVPAVVLGVMVFFWLPDRPREARWLSEEEKEALEQEVERSRSGAAMWRGDWKRVVGHGPTWVMAFVLFSIAASNYALDTFLPTMLRDWYGLSRDRMTTLLMVPPIFALLGVVVMGWSSDRFGERRWHAAGCVMLAAVGMAIAPMTNGTLVLTMICVSGYAWGNKGSQPPFWAMPSLMLSGSAAAAATGVINSVGNLGGFFGPMVLGRIEKETGSFLPGLYGLAGLLVAGGVSLILLRVDRGRRKVISAQSVGA